jgi:hypothetical protein
MCGYRQGWLQLTIDGQQIYVYHSGIAWHGDIVQCFIQLGKAPARVRRWLRSICEFQQMHENDEAIAAHVGKLVPLLTFR